MSKDAVEFPWRSPFEDSKAPPAPVAVPEIPGAKIPKHIKIAIACVGAILVLIAMLMSLKKDPPPQQVVSSPAGSTLSIMVPVIPFLKGSTIEPHFLKAVIAPAKSFSKTQLLSVFTEDDIARVDNRLVAKKDLPPYRPIFWTSLELKKIPTAKSTKVEIIYPKTEGSTP